MNNIVNQIISELKDFGCIGIKAEFEAEGTRDGELVWISTLARKNNLPITLKIGGCEALRDLFVAKQFDIEKVVAPMIESSYALKKYTQSIRKVFPSKDRKFLFNVETISGFDKILEIFEVAKNDEYIDGIVFGRVDFVGSLGMSRSQINTSYVNYFGNLTSTFNMEFIVGGSIDDSSYGQLKNMPNVTGFETRKLIFDSSIIHSINENQFSRMIGLCVKFELLWLEWKKEHYSFIAREDQDRIELLENRVKLYDFF